MPKNHNGLLLLKTRDNQILYLTPVSRRAWLAKNVACARSEKKQKFAVYVSTATLCAVLVAPASDKTTADLSKRYGSLPACPIDKYSITAEEHCGVGSCP